MTSKANGNIFKRYQNSISLVSILTLSTILITACAEPIRDDEEIEKRTQTALPTLIRGNGPEPSSLNPQAPHGLTEMMILYDLFEGLTVPAPSGGVLPGVATHWETRDGLTYRFYLRDDARWSNGDAVTAHDFVRSWRSLASPERDFPESSLSQIAPIQNTKAIESGEMPVESLGILALDDFTLEVALEEKVYDFIERTSFSSLLPIHTNTLEKYGKDWTRPENFVGNGAFTLDKWVVNERLEVIPNPYYWDSDELSLGRVAFLPLGSRKAEIDRFRTGELHITHGVPSEHYEDLARNFPKELYDTMVSGALGLNVNVAKPPLNDPRLRKALAYALDRQVLATAIAGVPAKPVYNYGAEVTLPGDSQTSQWRILTQAEREQEARNLYHATGFSDAKPLKVKLIYAASEQNKKIVLAVAAMWNQVLGALVTPEGKEWKVWGQSITDGDFDLTLFKPMYTGEPARQYQRLATGGFQNFGGFHNQNYDALAARTTTTLDFGLRHEIYAQLEAILAEEMPYIPLYEWSMSRLVSEQVQGYESTTGMIPLSKFLSFEGQTK